MTCPELPAAGGQAPELLSWTFQLRNIQREGWAEFTQQLVWDVPGGLPSPGSRRGLQCSLVRAALSPCWYSLRRQGSTCSLSSLRVISDADMKKISVSLFSARSQDCFVSNLLERAGKNPLPQGPTGEEVLCSGDFVQADALNLGSWLRGQQVEPDSHSQWRECRSRQTCLWKQAGFKLPCLVARWKHNARELDEWACSETVIPLAVTKGEHQEVAQVAACWATQAAAQVAVHCHSQQHWQMNHQHHQHLFASVCSSSLV